MRATSSCVRVEGGSETVRMLCALKDLAVPDGVECVGLHPWVPVGGDRLSCFPVGPRSSWGSRLGRHGPWSGFSDHAAEGANGQLLDAAVTGAVWLSWGSVLRQVSPTAWISMACWTIRASPGARRLLVVDDTRRSLGAIRAAGISVSLIPVVHCRLDTQ